MGCTRWYRRHTWTKWRIEEKWNSTFWEDFRWQWFTVVIQSKSCSECRFRKFKREQFAIGHVAKQVYENKTEEVDNATLN